MPAANKLAYFLDTVRGALATEPTFLVQKVLNKAAQPTAQRTIVYPFIVSVTGGTMLESSRIVDGTCTVRIWADVAVSSETATPTGKSFAAYADTISKIEKAIRTIPFSVYETHTDGTTTAIHVANVTLVGGHVDNGDNKIEADCDVLLSFGHWA
jgi:hypothetical protein